MRNKWLIFEFKIVYYLDNVLQKVVGCKWSNVLREASCKVLGTPVSATNPPHVPCVSWGVTAGDPCECHQSPHMSPVSLGVSLLGTPENPRPPRGGVASHSCGV